MKYARKCSATGEGMNEGWVTLESGYYFKYEEDALRWAIDNGHKSLGDAHDEEAIYWTMWDDTSEYQYEEVDGLIVEVDTEEYDIAKAKQTLRNAGYYVDVLWNVREITDRYQCPTEQAKLILKNAIENTMDEVWANIMDEVWANIMDEVKDCKTWE